YVIEPEPVVSGETPDAHRMDLQNVFASVGMLGGELPPLTIVGCEPATVEDGIGLSPAVERAVDAALPLIRRIVAAALGHEADFQPASLLESKEERQWSKV
ncbi:MAG: hypothetical protein M3R44_03900, partial [Candidatus Eremiobacteraeota bacterium]|nr:hypothetical protein [Candidatus Eremiobacteraeota bacterium]